MNSRKEVILATVLALLLASGLGAVSYSLFAGMPVSEKPKAVLDVYTQKGGLGANASGGVFEPFDEAFFFAYLTRGGGALKNSEVNFTLKSPVGSKILRTAQTNDSGVAVIDFTFLPSEESIIGSWEISATASVDEKIVEDTLNLQCHSLSAQINVYTKRNSKTSAIFLPKDEVSVDAQVTYKGTSVAGAEVSFEVRYPNNTVFLTEASQTSTSGVATIAFRIPWPSESSIGVWHISVESEVYQQPISNYAEFTCQLLPNTLDVFTQKGGRGQNVAGGIFMLNETVILYGEIRDQLNETVPNKLVSFEVKVPPDRRTFVWRVESTNSSGIAMVTFRIPPVEDFIGIWEVYARTEYNGTVLLDTLTFTCEQQE